MKIKLNSYLYHRAVASGDISSMLEVQRKSGLSYPTVHKMTTGKYSAITFDCIARYYEAIGVSVEGLRNMLVKDIFDID